MTNDEVQAAVADVIRETFDLSPDYPVERETTALDIDGWDSLAQTTLLLMVERRFGVEIDRSVEFDDVGGLVDTIHELLEARGR